ncbi:hypothetical protein RCL_jg1037.t1 [Rhizophagus clarus]|uniref:Uncharacterized protein n=1 Tax=Rhizophagus clarus TaxID=94130 RepID=A0A8H3R1M0_9GLOM|nr:hypothetical protein RCL_jg1037.t1 [Rhizophagus clarus]
MGCAIFYLKMMILWIKKCICQMEKTDQEGGRSRVGKTDQEGGRRRIMRQSETLLDYKEVFSIRNIPTET